MIYDYFSGTFADTAECSNLAPGGVVEFQVELQATSCANAKNGKIVEKFEVYPTGLTESVEITAEVDCSCTCGDIVCMLSYFVFVCFLLSFYNILSITFEKLFAGYLKRQWCKKMVTTVYLYFEVITNTIYFIFIPQL